jgi:hypothetical protein
MQRMHSVNKIFALIDRKVGAFDFYIKKVKGKDTGNEYFAVGATCIIKGEDFQKNVLTIGCPQKAIESIAKDILGRFNASIGDNQEAPSLRKVETPKITLSAHSSNEGKISFTAIPSEVTEEVDENDYELFDGEVCPGCGDDTSECTCEASQVTNGVTLTPVSSFVQPLMRASAVKVGPQDCPYCGGKVAPNFAYCQHCGGQQ